MASGKVSGATMVGEDRGIWRWLFEDRESGRIVVAQWPNLTMVVTLVALAATYVLPAGRASVIARIVMLVGLALWALDEATRGVNPWRRILGVGTLAAMAVWLIVLKR